MPEPVDTLAAIDVGTNSFHLVVARVTGEDRFEVVDQREGDGAARPGGGDMKLLDADAIDRGVDALRRLKQIADIHDAPVRAVATSAIREAENHDVFVRRARDEAGVERRGRSPASRRPASSTSACSSRCRSSTSACSCATSAAAAPSCSSASGARCWRPAASSSARSASPTASSPASASTRAPSSSCRSYVRSHPRARSPRRSRPTASRWRSARRARSRRSPRWPTPRPASRRCGPTTASRFTRDELPAVVERLVDARRRRAAGQAPRARRRPRRHHPRRRAHPRRRLRGLRRRGDDGQRLRAARGRAARHHPAHAGRLAPPPARRLAAQRPRPRRAVRRGARALGPRGPPGPRAVRRHGPDAHGLDEGAGSTSRPPRCSPTWGCSSPTASTTCTRTT